MALRFLASQLHSTPHVIGLEILNEPANTMQLQGWYESTLKEIRQVTGPDFPIYISDAWDTAHYAGWVDGRKDFIVLDHHLYRCFTEEDKSQNGDQHARNLRSGFAHTFEDQSASAKGSIVVGEWSASLDPKGLGNMSDTEKDRHRREFVKAQLELFEKSSAGYWFWNYKTAEAWNAGWSARNASQAEILPRKLGKTFRGSPPGNAKDSALQSAHRKLLTN